MQTKNEIYLQIYFYNYITLNADICRLTDIQRFNMACCLDGQRLEDSKEGKTNDNR